LRRHWFRKKITPESSGVADLVGAHPRICG
jgi:hypothetical protein